MKTKEDRKRKGRTEHRPQQNIHVLEVRQSIRDNLSGSDNRIIENNWCPNSQHLKAMPYYGLFA